MVAENLRILYNNIGFRINVRLFVNVFQISNIVHYKLKIMTKKGLIV